ncbi:DUF2807 domain-containing protein [Muricauda sp. SCSIO 64092]|uniref:head GIN domain-containing protein n=1 Tax=Allomuricauda sp. SCSIO 64092 TaxID=2908842 RepID=UPI001FF34442|nr:head GIN domain-containing protein [Muricauda sp. SCSIO 64092]UOY06412.1 DUF2807 domain-containing protein [Muricauda sp. SCSIO 64092]
MKSTLIHSLILATVLLVSSCDTESIRVSDTISTRQYSFSNYEALELSGDFNAFVTFSETEERIEIEANDNIQSKIRVSQDGNTLKIRLENNVALRGNATMNAYITTRNISRYRVSGDSSVELENLLVANTVTVDVLGDSRFYGEVDTNNLSVDVKGDSVIDVFGTAGTANVDLSGDSTIKDYDLVVEDLTIDMSGDSSAYLSVNGTIDIDASGDSALNYRGDAEIIRQRLTGDSRIQKRD